MNTGRSRRYRRKLAKQGERKRHEILSARWNDGNLIWEQWTKESQLVGSLPADARENGSVKEPRELFRGMKSVLAKIWR